MSATKDAKGGRDSGHGPTKQIYTTPRLEIYGDVGEITRSKANMGAKDGGTMALFDRTAT